MTWLRGDEIQPRNRGGRRRVYRDQDGDYVLTGGGAYPYEIERSRINTGPKLVEWTLHLLGKDWVTKDDLEALMLLVIEDFPNVIDRNC